jgi:hypothetical protein
MSGERDPQSAVQEPQHVWEPEFSLPPLQESVTTLRHWLQ